MEVRFITLYHQLTCALVHPTHTSSIMNLPLVVGTSNNLYKIIEQEEDGAQAKINAIIIELWHEKIAYVVDKVASLEAQLGVFNGKGKKEPLYFRVEYIKSNIIASSLAGLFERLDKMLVGLESLARRGMDSGKYDRFLLYFGDKLSEILHFPYQQSPELHQRILRSQL